MDDATLNALLSADAPPARDPRFVVAVMARLEKRRFRQELAMTAGLAGLAILLLALVMPKVDIGWIANLPPIYNVAIATLLMVAVSLMPRFFASPRD